ncbi:MULTISPECIES: EF-hand domain-containing protein [Methylosinus]|uniref:EF-hand domain-containing protein n=1 Tax=Methylosinus TaxID=425 RepID=UPI00140E1D91|nr:MULTISPECIES: EF-hand domain-containing protein [Methylosinus]MBU3890581.1 EF-hand domain-containing protein [Methylosinus sp. KRF6]
MGRAAVRLAAGLLALVSSAALAQQHRPRGVPIDAPRGPTGGGGADDVLATSSEWGGAGGVYTCEQWKQYLERMFRLADKRKRGFIDAQDFEIIPRASVVFRSATFDYFDMAGKGRVTRAEFLAFPSPFFARYDRKKSCRVFQEELARAQAPSGGSQSPAPQSGGGFPGRGGGGGFGGGYGGGGFGGGGGGFGR